MAISQKIISCLLIAILVLGNAVCICDANASVESIDAGQHAHHQSGTDGATKDGCPHSDCDGDCPTVTGAVKNKSQLIPAPRLVDLEDPADVAVTDIEPIPVGRTIILGSDPNSSLAAAFETPLSRFDRLLI